MASEAPIKGEMPPDLVLASGYKLRLLAIDPTTGAAVTGVTLNNVVFFVTDVLGAADGGAEGPPPSPLLIPSEDFA